MKTSPKTSRRICNRKKRFATRDSAEEVAACADVTLRAYKCELCHQYHLTGRTKGMKLPAFEVANRREEKRRAAGECEAGQAKSAGKTAPS